APSNSIRAGQNGSRPSDGRQLGCQTVQDYYNCVFKDPYEDGAMSAVLATMLSRLHAKDPMSVDELLNPLDENTTAEDPTDEDFCGVGDQRLAEDGSEAGSESPGQDMERSIKKDFELEAVKEHIMWIDKLLVRAGATGVSDIS
ncbi:hypothetical protein L915_19336, partial [Phytophthora nicotianae]